jgi:MFS family permease
MDGMDQTAAAEPPITFSRRYRTWLLSLLLLVWSFNFADRFIIPIQGQAIRADLGIGDFQLGLVQGLGFAVIYTLAGLPVARLADRASRVAIIGAGVAIWAVSVSVCGLARNFGQLFLCRIGVGAGDAGFVTPVGSLLSDHYTPKGRASALSIINLAAPIGSTVGAIGCGWIGQHYGWRMSFLVVGLPGFALAALAFLTLREPPRGMADGGLRGAAPATLAEVAREMFRKPTFRQVLIGLGAAVLGMNMIGQFLPPYFARTFHMGLAEAAFWFSVASFFPLMIGLLGGGFGGDRLIKRDRRWHPWLAATGVLLACPFYLVFFLQTDIWRGLPALLVAQICLFLFYSPTQAMVQNMAPPLMRASAGYLYALVVGVVGAGIGPTLAGFLSDRFARASFAMGDYGALCPAPGGSADTLVQACGEASRLGLRDALMPGAVLFAWAAVHLYLSARTLEADLYVAPRGDGEA